jgi:hypothetical protein
LNDQQAETFRALVPLSTEALKAVVLLNGGAIVALLAYLGQSSARVDLARRVGCPLTWFVAGIVLATLAFGSAYLTQLALFNKSVEGDKFKGIGHRVWLKGSFALALLGLICFACGAFASIRVLAYP